ncbi:MAG: aminodeoxychorismate synthase component I [Abditibacteriales bacterium]|nr:aminodeoxychorismate synthase component I [Abditibacteriales bacterium]MDW8367254.1 aminodeoxychorismate synthase component I [Abditibacteriales bacterium]
MQPFAFTTESVFYTAEQAINALREVPYGFFLDSGMDPSAEGRWGRYSFVGMLPFLILRGKGLQMEVITAQGCEQRTANPFDVLRELLKRFQLPDPPDTPALPGAAVGYLGYDLRHFVEELPCRASDDLHLPDLYLAFYARLITMDHHTGKAYETRYVPPDPPSFIDLPPVSRFTFHASRFTPHVSRPVFHANFTKEAYLAAVQRVKDYIAAGDVYQVNLSQRFAMPITMTPEDLYLRLRAINPAPFAAFLKFPEFSILSASPERFLHFDPRTRRVHTRPIKGTRPRGQTPEEDERLARELLDSEKDRAEHVMIVDLERNDLGRVAETGSVRVREMATLERFPTVFHLTSTVEATLRVDQDPVDLLRATFPGGSITGAPKIRAMEIIDELEPTTRGVYTGSIGYFAFDERMDLNIAIRTLVVKDGIAYFQVGGGIVADSEPEAEYQETLDKAAAMMRAVG